MKKELGIGLISILFLVGIAMAVKPDKCATIKDGTITDVKDNTLTMGYDQWGYNYQAHMFNGWYHNAPRPVPPWTYETLIEAEKSTTWLVMWWSDEWLSNKDCIGNGKLDRGYSCDPVNAKSSACDGAWLTNHQWGSYEEENGETCKWNYFVKMVYVNPDNAYKEYNEDDETWYWYTEEGDEKIGSVIWGAYARILQIYNDPCAGETGVENNFEEPAGFGFYKQEANGD